MPKRRINAAGEIVEEPDDVIPVETSTTTPSAAPDASSFSSFFLSTERVDVFGHSLERRQVLMGALFAFLFLGLRGMLFLMMGMSLYRSFNRGRSAPTSSPWPSQQPAQSSSSSSSSASNRRDVANRWASRFSGGGGAGSNIRGMSDLPCDPKRG